MTPADIKAIRLGLGLTGAEFARLLGYTGAGVRHMMFELERGSRTIRPAQERLAIAYSEGYRPKDWPYKGIERITGITDLMRGG